MSQSAWQSQGDTIFNPFSAFISFLFNRVVDLSYPLSCYSSAESRIEHIWFCVFFSWGDGASLNTIPSIYIWTVTNIMVTTRRNQGLSVHTGGSLRSCMRGVKEGVLICMELQELGYAFHVDVIDQDRR